MKKHYPLIFALFILSSCIPAKPISTSAPGPKYYKEVFDFNGIQGAYRMFSETRLKLIEGQFTDGKKSGVWTFFDRKGEVFLVFNFDTLEASESQLKYKVKVDNTWADVDQVQPYSKALGDYVHAVYKKFHYPEIAYSNGVEGKNIAGIYLSPEGKVVDIKMLREIGAQTSAQCLKMLRVMDIVWEVPPQGEYTIFFPVVFKK